MNAGGKYGFQLLWAILFAAIATIIFQGMAARLGLVTGKGLAESLRDYFRDRRLQKVSLILVMAAIVLVVVVALLLPIMKMGSVME